MEITQLITQMVNVYLVKTDNGYFMIDTGLEMSRKKLEKAFKSEEINPAEITLVIITHGDIDHIGNCAYLKKKYGLKIAVHECDADLCRTGKINSSRKIKSTFLSKIFRSIISVLIVKPVMKKYPVETFEPDIILTDGQNLQSLGFDAKVIHIPGHTKGSIGLLTDKGDFFSGDTINNRTIPTAANIIENEDALNSSLEKIKQIPIRNVYPGHGSPFPMARFQNLF